MIRYFESIAGEKCLITFDDANIMGGNCDLIDTFVLEDC